MRLDKLWFCFGDVPKRFCYYDAEAGTWHEITDLDEMSDFVLANANKDIRDFFVSIDSFTFYVTVEEKADE